MTNGRTKLVGMRIVAGSSLVFMAVTGGLTVPRVVGGSLPDCPFRILGSLPGQAAGGTVALGVSADGTTVVGQTAYVGPDPINPGQTVTTHLAFRWTAAGGMVSLGDLPEDPNTINPLFQSIAITVSADGSVVVGDGFSDAVDQVILIGATHAFRWEDLNGNGPDPSDLLDLGVSIDDCTDIEATCKTPRMGVSADGSAVVGTARRPEVFDNFRGPIEAYRWTQSTGMVGLGYLDPNPGTGLLPKN